MKASILHFLRQYKVHLISWITFIAYEVSVVGAATGTLGAFGDYLLHYAINIMLFYVHATIVLPFVLQKDTPRYWLLPFVVAAEIATYIAVVYAAEYVYVHYLGQQLTRPFVLDFIFLIRSVWRSLYFMSFATGYYFLRNYLSERKRVELAEKQSLLNIIENQRLQSELVRSQNAFLKAQINPHFLFNTLGFVYNSVRKTSAPAADAIMALSQMMRYALQNENEYEESDVLEEIEHVNNLIQIHQTRHEHQLQIQFTHDSNLAGVKVIPLVLITLVENVFQHADLTRPNHPAKIDVRFEDNTLYISTVNLKKYSQQSGNRIGLDNIQRRLQHAYRDKVNFKAAADANGSFLVNIRITGISIVPQIKSLEYLVR